MIAVNVNTSKAYNVLIDSELFEDFGKHVLSVTSACKTAIISDSNVWPLYGTIIQKRLQEHGFSVCSYVFPAGEESKNIHTYFSILNFLAENRLTRTDLVIALGGGVVGDLTGFASSTYLRGVRYIQVPTSLLAMVDSSVGGKTAIDLPAGKNLAGAFYQPSLVICDISVLKTLPLDTFRDGCAEVIKYGILYDEALFSHLLDKGIDFDLEYVIARCIALKRDVVSADEFDKGQRQKLNLGHTFGHAIEASSNFTISHGKAVAIGMAMAARSAASLNLCTTETVSRIIEILNKFSLPCNTAVSPEVLTEIALSDKKRDGSILNLILPERIGHCVIRREATEKIQSLIKAGI